MIRLKRTNKLCGHAFPTGWASGPAAMSRSMVGDATALHAISRLPSPNASGRRLTRSNRG